MSAYQDYRYAVRSLVRRPGFSLAVVLTLALGIGANTAIFSVVDGVLLLATPLRDADRLMMVWETDRKSSTQHEPSAIPDYFDFRLQARRFAELAAFTPAEISLNTDGGEPQRIAALAVTHTFLPMVGLAPILGRTLNAEEDQPGGPRSVVISEELWTRLFARDQHAIGRTIRLNDNAWTVVGVLPASADFGMLQILGAADYGRGFADRGGRVRVDVWAPLRAGPQASRDNHPILVMGRLADGATAGQAQLEMASITAELERLYHASNDGRGAYLEPLSDVVFGPVRPALLVLLGAVALVLLVACANVANLLLARGTSRVRELSVRAALGADAGRLARQFLAESVVLCLTGAALGVFLAVTLVDGLLTFAPASIPRVADVSVDARVLAATLAITMLVALVFGLLPMLQVRGLSFQAVFQAGARRSTGSPRQNRLRSALVSAELALALMLMAGAGLLIRSLWQLQGVDPGFRAAGVLKAEFDLPASRYPRDFSVYPRWAEIQRFRDVLRERAAALPGVTSATIAGNHPLDAGFTSSIAVVGREAEAADWPEPAIRQIDPGYFETLQLKVTSGRPFAASDDAAAPTVMLVNEAARRRYFAERDPIGQHIRLWGAERLIVGVVGDERLHGLDEAVPPGVYLPAAQAPTSGGSLMVRTSGDPAALAGAVRGIVRELDPGLPLFAVEPLERTLSDSMGQRHFTMLVLGLFASVALALAIIGVHGVLSYAVAQRTREIGIRVALGADLGNVRALVLSQGARLTAFGLGFGLLGALALSRAMTTLLYGIRPWDPATLAGITLILAAVAMLAAWLPARRAARTDPMAALRSE